MRARKDPQAAEIIVEPWLRRHFLSSSFHSVLPQFTRSSVGISSQKWAVTATFPSLETNFHFYFRPRVVHTSGSWNGKRIAASRRETVNEATVKSLLETDFQTCISKASFKGVYRGTAAALICSTLRITVLFPRYFLSLLFFFVVFLSPLQSYIKQHRPVCLKFCCRRDDRLRSKFCVNQNVGFRYMGLVKDFDNNMVEELWLDHTHKKGLISKVVIQERSLSTYSCGAKRRFCWEGFLWVLCKGSILQAEFNCKRLSGARA